MKTVQINNVNLPAVGIGTWQVGDNAAHRAEESAAIRAGIDQGMTVIDTAEMYGDGRAERLIKTALAGIPRERLFIIDKVLPGNASRRRLETSLDRSPRNVGTDYFDLYLLHWRGSIPLAETVTVMEEMVAKGKIRSWGVSNFDVADMQELWQLPNGQHCAANQDLYNLDSGIEYDLLPLMRAHQLPLIAYSPLAQGDSLSGKLHQHPLLREIAANHHVSVYQVMLAWTLRNGNVLTIPKSSTVDHMLSNWQAGQIELATDELSALARYFPAPQSKQPLAVI